MHLLLIILYLASLATALRICWIGLAGLEDHYNKVEEFQAAVNVLRKEEGRPLYSARDGRSDEFGSKFARFLSILWEKNLALLFILSVAMHCIALIGLATN